MSTTTNPNAEQLRGIVAAMGTASTSTCLELIGAALLVIADAMEPCEDCGRKPAVIDPADNPETGADPVDLAPGMDTVEG